MKILITGINGFVARHLAEHCLDQENGEVHGLIRPRSAHAIDPALKACIKTWSADLEDHSALKKILKRLRPERIFHLAAVTSVPVSWKHPERTVRTNILGTYYLLEAVRELKLKCRIHIASSSEEYGRVEAKHLPVGEDTRLWPVSPYGVSKVGQDILGRFYHEAFGLHVVVTRAFSHTGPGQSDRFVSGSFARQVAQTEASTGKRVIYTGNLDNIRDFSDVRDVARAYWLALDKGRPGQVYNVASSRGMAVRYIAETLAGLASAPVTLKRDKARLRKSDVPRIIGDASKLRRDTGWRPEISAESMLSDLLNDWRERVASKNVPA